MSVSGCGYNTIPTLEEQAKAKWADVQNNYQRRADLIPNLVATVQGYAKQEKDVLTAVVEARAKATRSRSMPRSSTDPDKLKQFQDAQNQLSGALGRLLAVSENYPDLKSNQNFLALQSQLEGTENRIAVARRDYIEAVRAYNTELRDLPRHRVGQDALQRQQADGGIHRQRQRAEPAAGEVLIRPRVAAVKGTLMTDIRPAFATARGGVFPAAAVAAVLVLVCICIAGLAADLSAAHRPHRRSGQHHSGRRPARRSSRSSPIWRASPASSWWWRRSLRWRARRSSLTPIELFRTWKLGEKDKNNGVLLLVAPNEQRVRIEVGYGLEGTLTDALSKVIITNAIAPALQGRRFRRRDRARRRRHHHGPDHRQFGMAAEAVAAGRSCAGQRSQPTGFCSPHCSA